MEVGLQWCESGHNTLSQWICTKVQLTHKNTLHKYVICYTTDRGRRPIMMRVRTHTHSQWIGTTAQLTHKKTLYLYFIGYHRNRPTIRTHICVFSMNIHKSTANPQKNPIFFNNILFVTTDHGRKLRSFYCETRHGAVCRREKNNLMGTPHANTDIHGGELGATAARRCMHAWRGYNTQ